MRCFTFLTTVFLIGFFNVAAQPLRGVLRSTDDKSPVAYASLVIVGTGWGTASDSEGGFLLHLRDTTPTQVIRITCIGFRTADYTLSTLMKQGTLWLETETKMLEAITVGEGKITALEILEEAIQHIPDNYSQSPFNLEFYSQHTTRDTLDGSTYTLESVFESYTEGYRADAMKNYRITQKRESGDYFMKETKHGMSQWPMVEVAFNDLCSKEPKLDILTPNKLDKIRPELLGMDKYDGDTVFVVRYHHEWTGTLFISAKDNAILMHRIEESHRGLSKKLELRYRMYSGHYFPYSALGEYQQEYKVDGRKKVLRISNRVVLRKIEIDQVNPFGNNHELWFPRNVKFDKDWWEKNYPRLRGYNGSPITGHWLPITGH